MLCELVNKNILVPCHLSYLSHNFCTGMRREESPPIYVPSHPLPENSFRVVKVKNDMMQLEQQTHLLDPAMTLSRSEMLLSKKRSKPGQQKIHKESPLPTYNEHM